MVAPGGFMLSDVMRIETSSGLVGRRRDVGVAPEVEVSRRVDLDRPFVASMIHSAFERMETSSSTIVAGPSTVRTPPPKTVIEV